MASTMLAPTIEAFYHVVGGSMKERSARVGSGVVTAALLACWWVLVIAPPAEAYIDPSAGGMLVQLLLAGTAGVAVLVKLMWSRIKRVFGAADAEPPAGEPDESPTPHDRV